MRKLQYILSVMTVSLTLVGCAIGYVYHILPNENPLITHADQMQKDFTHGIVVLANCNYFIKTYPKYHKALLSHTNVYFAYSTDPIMKPYYAITDATANKITFGPNYFNTEDDQRRAGVIAHEMLHVIGMPHHKNNLPTNAERWADPIYTVEHECFHPLEPWSPLERTPNFNPM